MTGRQCNDPIRAGNKQCIGHNHEAVGLSRDNRRKCNLNVTLINGVDNEDLNAFRTSSRLELPRIGFGIGIIRVRQKGNQRGLGYHFM